MIKEEVKQQVIELRKSRKTYNEIHDLTGVAKSSISDICRPMGLGNQQVTELTEDLIRQAQELYNKIGNVKKIAKEMRISSQRLSKVLTLNKPSNISKSESVINWRKRTKIKLVEYKGG